MIIKSLHITDFSGTKGRDVVFGPGFNVISGPNESGKTTVASFIRFIMYGLADKAERTRWFSWGSPSAVGSMTVEENGRSYRIERECLGPGKDKARIIDLETGSPCFVGEEPADVFLGVTADLFAHTAYIGQAAGGEVDGEKVSSAIENMLFSGDEATNTDRAAKKLDDARILLYHKSHKGGRIFDLTEERDALALRLENSRRANETLVERESELRETRELLEANKKKLAEAEAGLAELDESSKRKSLLRLKELSDKADALSSEYEAQCRADDYRGFTPDSAYAAEADWAERDVERIGTALDEARSEYEAFALRGDDLKPIRSFNERLESAGGQTAVAERLKSAHSRISRMKGLAVFAFFAAALAAAFAVCSYFIEFPKPFAFLSDGLVPTLVGAAAALTLLLIGVAATVSRSRARLEINELLCDLDVDSEEELENRLSTLNFDETKLRIHDSRAAEYKKRIDDLTVKKEKADAEAARIAEKWGRTSIAGIAADAAASLEKRAALQGEIDKFSLARDTLADELGISDVPAALAGIAADAGSAQEYSPEAEESLRRDYEFYTAQNGSLTDRARVLEKELAVLNATVEPAYELSARVDGLDREIARLTSKHDALILARDELIGAADDLRNSVSPRLAATAGELIDSMTGGKYSSLGVGSALQLAFDRDEQSHGVEYMSAGTRDVAYLALRFSLIDLLYGDKTPPLIFDESFSRLDDDRFRLVVDVISRMAARGVQTLLFTSQTRDVRIARERDETVNPVDL